ncbi:MAG: hypothetical protein CVT94_15410 [Bacteroidetes bacterium HGW-Bacteroidetes-11]|nr:MAG: hypothetical protein CVT94_15410 [Bacteroidetes bacterium HGW-Bacteroidetes-11]
MNVAKKTIEMKVVQHENESYFKISDHDGIRPFFMSIVSDSNHWMFISSNGGLTAGRKNPEYALFPYYTDDKITESADITGSKSIFRIKTDDSILVWEPFSERFTGKFSISRNLYKSIYGNKIIFEEINHDLGLKFSYQWNSSKLFGFVRKASLQNTSGNDYQISLLDGIQNIMPFGVPSDLQRSTSNLVDAYKRSELEAASGIGIYALSAIIVDKAEPSEALKANIAWSLGLDKPKHLLSSLQLDNFRMNREVAEESDIKGEKGAYFVCAEILLPAQSEKNWKLIANVNQNSPQIIGLSQNIKDNINLERQIQEDIDSGTEKLIDLVASADGLQYTADKLNDSRHFSNVLFNIMRGGIFDNGYLIKKGDFADFLMKANKEVVAKNQEFIGKLQDTFSQSELKSLLSECKDADLIRLSAEYLPLKFSRRHGDPSRPWNYFTINIQNETDGSEILDYEGNWRDIFQNWEALANSYPEFVTNMIIKFLNASTFDGYNPYRITKDGFDWETIEPDNPWSYIGYWGDHQIIYLQKFFEITEKFYPGTLQSFFDKDWFVYAAVPYKIKPYSQILKNPKDTIEFDHKWDGIIRKNRELIGADGALLTDSSQAICHVNFIEKILATVLAKISNFIPEAGIWMNTQRPEWNDANNALVGNGVSMVTLYYLHRFLKFFGNVLGKSRLENVMISEELNVFYHALKGTLTEFSPLLTNNISDSNRKAILDRLGRAASDYRQQIYNDGFKGSKQRIPVEGLNEFTGICLEFIEHSIRANQRTDKLYHAYNLMTSTDTGVSCSHLSEMLEGQVAVLSSGYLTPEQSLEVLDALKSSALFRKDQYSYILYPEKELPGFLLKNNIPPISAQKSELIKKLVADGNKEIVDQDILGGLHFNGNFKNAADLSDALNKQSAGVYHQLVEKDRRLVLDIFEEVFNHKAFTGRSGTFYSFEGLGSIYWHMVSKLHLAVQECCLKAIETGADKKVIGRLMDHYYEIEAGIGVHKSPELYGAFPTDPYSHTPKHRGAQQPGMTGQVKEDILVRFGELGVFVNDGKLYFNPWLLRNEELHNCEGIFEFRKCAGGAGEIELATGQLAFTFCQTPIVYHISDTDRITVHYGNGTKVEIEGTTLNNEISNLIFRRTGEIEKVEVSINKK